MRATLQKASAKPVIAAALLCTVAAWVGVRTLTDPSWVLILDNLQWTSAYVTALLLATGAWLTRTGSERTIAGGAAWAMAAMAVGQMVWNVQVLLDWLPFPGPSDAFFLLCGAISGITVWHIGKARLIPSAWRALRLDAVTLLTGVVCCSLMLYLPRQGTYTGVQLAIMVAYPVCFAFPPLLLLALLLALRCKLQWRSLTLPLAQLVMAGLWGEWNRRFLQNQLVDGAWLNIGFSVAAILIGWGARNLQLDINPDPRWDRRCEYVIRQMPIFMVSLAAAGVVGMESVGGFSDDVRFIGLGGALLAVVLATIRQSYLLQDRDRLLQAEILVSERETELEALNRELEARVEQRTAELVQSQKLAALGSLVAGVAHELNTPIGNARLVAGTLQEEAHAFFKLQETQALRRSDLQAFAKRAVEASHMVDQSLARAVLLIQSFKQVAVDRTSEVMREFDVHGVVDGIVQVQRIVYKHRTLAILNQVEPGISMLSYPGALGQLLDILIENAGRHAFDAVEGAEIRIQAARGAADSLVLRVQDNGVGIPAENLARLFDPFFTTKMGQGGSGLGLHVAWNLVHGMLNGKLKVQSTVGQGTTFWLEIPLHVR